MRLLKALPLFLFLGACASNPNRAEKLETRLEKSQVLSEDSSIGEKDDSLIFQKKALVAEDLRRLQYDVHGLEDRTYGGTRYYGNPGIWGALNECRLKLASIDNGGSGKLTYIEPLEYVVPDDEAGKIGYDETGQLVSVTEEFLKDRIKRYLGYKKILTERNRQIADKFEMCRLELQVQKKRAEPDRTDASLSSP